MRTIRLALRSAGALRLVASIDGRWSARRALFEHEPDVVIVDEMRQTPYARLRIQEVGEVTPQALLVLLTSGLGTASLEHAFDAGANAIVSRQLGTATLGTLLRELTAGAVFHAPSRPAIDHTARTSA